MSEWCACAKVLRIKPERASPMVPCEETSIKTTFFVVTGISVAVNQIFIFVLWMYMWGVAKSESIGGKPLRAFRP